MLSEAIRLIAFQLLIAIGRTAAGAVASSSPVPPALQNLMEAYWDVVYLYRYGLPEIPIEIPPGPSPVSSQSQPGPFSLSGSLVRDSLLLDVVDLAMGDTNPQPNSWFQVLRNKKIRIASAKKMRDHFKKAIPQLEAEAKRLETLQ